MSRYSDYLARSGNWETFGCEVGALRDDTVRDVKGARVLGLLRSWGFKDELAGEHSGAGAD